MNKILFVLKPHSIVDVITNSSSELFVGTSQSKEHMKELLEAVYPDYLKEYAEIRGIDELESDDLDTYFQFACSAHMWPSKRSDLPILPGFTFDELYEAKDGGEPAWNGHVQYRLRQTNKDRYEFVTEDNFEEIKNKLDPKREMYFLFSRDENPDWDKQNVLSSFMNRFHLG